MAKKKKKKTRKRKLSGVFRALTRDEAKGLIPGVGREINKGLAELRKTEPMFGTGGLSRGFAIGAARQARRAQIKKISIAWARKSLAIEEKKKRKTAKKKAARKSVKKKAKKKAAKQKKMDKAFDRFLEEASRLPGGRSRTFKDVAKDFAKAERRILLEAKAGRKAEKKVKKKAKKKTKKRRLQSVSLIGRRLDKVGKVARLRVVTRNGRVKDVFKASDGVFAWVVTFTGGEQYLVFVKVGRKSFVDIPDVAQVEVGKSVGRVLTLTYNEGKKVFLHEFDKLPVLRKVIRFPGDVGEPLWAAYPVKWTKSAGFTS